MKKLLAISLILGMLLCTAGCGNSATEESNSDTSAATSATDATSSAAEASDSDDVTEDAVNEGEFKAGDYAGNSEYAEGEFSMTWNYIVSLNEDGTFTITDNAGEEKGAGTYALTDDCYTMTYSDDRTCTFVVQADGTLKVLNDLPYGKASISPDMVGGIVLEYNGEAVSAPEEAPDTDEETPAAGDFSIAAGAYSASYTKESPMAGTVVYNYEATIGEDATFSYSVSFDMGGTMYDGCSASGTYTVDSGKFTFTDESGAVTEGTLTADNTLVISLKASDMAKEPYEVTFTAAEAADTSAAYSISAGAYTASYTKESPMAGTVVYNYAATVGENGTFSYSVSFDMGGTMYDGCSASGTYTVDGGKFTFTDESGAVTEGTLTDENTLVISLKASDMAKEPYEVTFTVA